MKCKSNVLVQFWLIVTAFESNIILSNCAQCIMRRGNTRLDWKWLNNTIVKIFSTGKSIYVLFYYGQNYIRISELKARSEIHTSYYIFLTILRKYIQHFFESRYACILKIDIHTLKLASQEWHLCIWNLCITILSAVWCQLNTSSSIFIYHDNQ